MIDSVQSGQNPPAATPSSPGNATGVDKESFLKLLVAQLEHQDPLSPMEGADFVAQLATFSQVEQALEQSRQLELISLQLTGVASNEAVGLIGKEVTVRGNKITHDGQTATGLSVKLEGATQSTTVTIRDANGKAVRTMELGAQPAGPLSIPWDGRNDAGDLAPAGSYTVEVSARDAAGDPVDTTQDVKGVVKSVNFEKGYPEIELESGATAPISDLVEVAQPSGPVAP